MSVLEDIGFEAGVPPSGWSQSGNYGYTVQSTSWPVEGTKSMRNYCSSAGAGSIYRAIAGYNLLVARFHVRCAALPSATANFMTFTHPSGSVYVRRASSGLWRVTLGSTNYDGPAFNVDTDYYIDIRLDATASMVVDWRVSGAAQTQRSIGWGAGNFSQIAMGNTGSLTVDAFYDAVKITDQSADYPLGPYVAPSTGMADPLGMSGFFGA